MTTEKRDQLSLGLDRLLEQFKDKPNMKAVLTSYLQQVNDLEDTYESLLNERSIFTAIGSQLDLSGALVNEQRLGRSDSVYRLAILTRIGINNSEGTPNEVLSVLKNITGATKVNVWEHFPVSAIYYANVELTDSTDCVSDTLQIISPATSGNVVTLFDPNEDALILSEMALMEFFLVDENGNLLVDDFGNFIEVQYLDHVDDGRLEYSYLSEILPDDLEVTEDGILLESLEVSVDGVATDTLETWSATLLETTDSPYSIPVEACKSS